MNDAIRRLTETLELEAVDTISFRGASGKGETEKLTASDRELFVLPEPENRYLDGDVTRQMAFVDPQAWLFQEGNKWRLF